METKNEFTVQYWVDYEAEKTDQLLKAQAEIKALFNNRPGILLRLAEQDQSALSDLKKCDERIDQLNIIVESIEELLKTIPARKDYARGVEIEALIPSIEKIEAEIPSLVADVDKKAAALLLASRKLYNFLGSFDEPEGTRSLSLQNKFTSDGVNELQSFRNIGMPGSENNSIDLEIVLMEMVYDKEKLSAWIDNARASVSTRLAKLRDYAQRLKGMDLPDRAWPYCPSCFEDVNFQVSGNKYHCPACKKTFDGIPVTIPSAYLRSSEEVETEGIQTK